MRRRVAFVLVLVAAASSTGARALPLEEDALELVDPMIGTSGSGFVFPGPAAPFGLVQLSPDTEGPVAYTGYSFTDKMIRGFSHVHTQSMGVWEGGELPLMPTVGDVVTDVKRYQSAFTHATEHAEVGSYAVDLANGVRAELTAGLRTGVHRYTFPAGSPGNVIIDAGRNVGDAAMIGPDAQNDPGRIPATTEILGDGTVVGSINETATGTRDYIVHFAIRSDVPADAFGVYAARGAAPQPGARAISGQGSGAYLTFASSASPRTVTLAVGVSFVDRAGAIANLESEPDAAAFDFDAVRDATRAAWRTELATIEVEGGTLPDRISFATSLYHAQHHPNVFNDADGRYRGYDRAVHRIGDAGDPMPAGSTYYANFSLWDTYRTQMPLLAWIQPTRYVEMMRSLHAVATQGGRLPHWGWMDRYADFMNGNPALPSIADGICRGIVPRDLAELLLTDGARLALNDGLGDTLPHRDGVYLSKGYVPVETSASGASATLEYATNDFSLALVADALGQGTRRDALLAQSGNWRNHFDPETRFMRPRHADGTWDGDPYVPELPEGWREGTGWQYTWLVPHDPAGLFAEMGEAPYPGELFVQQRLDEFFSFPSLLAAPHATAEAQQKATFYGVFYYGNQYAPSNEHDLQAPWLYAFTSQPWKTEAAVRAYQTLYRPTPDGLPGNDDLGTMSAWFVFSALGLYPVQAGSPVYTLATPSFDRAEVNPIGGPSTVIEAPGASLAQRFIGAATLDGAPLTMRSVTQSQLAGSTLSITPSGVPAVDRAALSPPPSASTDPLSRFGCVAA
jgi:predicted alpha-1,2-mannosidase